MILLHNTNEKLFIKTLIAEIKRSLLMEVELDISETQNLMTTPSFNGPKVSSKTITNQHFSVEFPLTDEKFSTEVIGKNLKSRF